MTKTQKQETIQKLAQDLQGNHFYIADSQGLTAQEVNNIRYTCFNTSIQYQVVKNTLLLKALKEVNPPSLNIPELNQKVLKGPTALFIIKENPSQPAKVLQDFHKTNKQTKPTLKAAFVYNDLIIGKEHLKSLAQLKSKEELLAQLIQLLQSPTNNLLSALQSATSNLVSSLQTLEKKKT